jgi:hypothetical protein
MIIGISQSLNSWHPVGTVEINNCSIRLRAVRQNSHKPQSPRILLVLTYVYYEKNLVKKQNFFQIRNEKDFFNQINNALFLFQSLTVQVQSTALPVGGSRDRSPVVSLGIFSVATDRSMCPGVESASKNEYQDTPRGKDGRCVRVKILPSSLCRKSRQSGALTYWNPLGHLGLSRDTFTFFYK